MSTSVSFSNGSFTTRGNVVVTRLQDGSYEASGHGNSPANNLGILGDTNGTKLRFAPPGPATTVRNLTANFGNKHDILKLGDSGGSSGMGNKGMAQPPAKAKGPKTAGNPGQGNTTQKFSAGGGGPEFVNADINMGGGDDQLIFGGAITNSRIVMGTGADAVEFKGNIDRVNLNLGGNGPDNQPDQIRISGDAQIRGLIITGADNADVLFIGDTEYKYNAANNNWVNPNDTNDTKEFK